MLVHEVAASVCPDLVRRVVERGGRSFIVTPFKYANGDFINAYVTQDHSGSVLSDLGATMYRLSTEGIELTEGREETVLRIAALHDMRMDDGVFTRAFDKANVGQCLIDFCAAIARISNLEFIDSRRRHSTIPDAVEAVMTTMVRPARHVEHEWTDKEIDPGAAYPVDYHVNSKGPPRNLFTVTSREKGIHVASVCNFFKAHQRYVPTMVVIDKDAHVAGRPLRQLKAAVDDLCFGVSGEESRIAGFALGKDLDFQLQPEPVH